MVLSTPPAERQQLLVYVIATVILLGLAAGLVCGRYLFDVVFWGLLVGGALAMWPVDWLVDAAPAAMRLVAWYAGAMCAGGGLGLASRRFGPWPVTAPPQPDAADKPRSHRRGAAATAATAATEPVPQAAEPDQADLVWGDGLRWSYDTAGAAGAPEWPPDPEPGRST